MTRRKQTLETLFRQHYRQMYRLATILLHDDAESKDVVHDVFARLLASSTELHEDTAAALLLTSVRNRCLNMIRDRKIQERVQRLYLLDLDTTLTLAKSNTLVLHRDPSVYGDIHFKLWNPEKEIAESQARLSIAGMETTSDENGNVALFVPLEKQRKSYHIESSLALYSDTIYMPCGENDVVLTR